ncbi:MAG: adenylate kinase [Anaerolineales bacterium]
MPTYFVMLGAPGAGKGTQAARLSQRLGVPPISSGDIFRQNLKEKTELGKTAEAYLGRGELVPDDITIAMIRERLAEPDCARGAILDGFPRTPTQAEALDGMLSELSGKVDAVLYIRARPEALAKRLAGRWVCRAQSHTYHVEFRAPKVPGVCDVDGSPLYQRDDDRPEAVAHRAQIFLETTAPLIEHYRGKGVLVEVDGEKPIADVTESLMAALPERA